MLRSGEHSGRTVAGKYHLGEVLGQGGMGVVYAARHQTTGRELALKLLRSELCTQADFVRRLEREARLAVRASHPNVVEVLDSGTDQSIVYLALERLKGFPLEAALDKPLGLERTAEVLVPIANALSALHEAGVVHRDVKPANVFIHRDGQGGVVPKLLDFGVAKLMDRSELTRSGMILGTPAYMSPEQVLGAGTVGPASDVWSFAVMWLRCQTGRYPHQDAEARLAALARGVAASELEGVEPALADVLQRALALDPNRRQPHLVALRGELLKAFRSLDAERAWPGEQSSGIDEASVAKGWLEPTSSMTEVQGQSRQTLSLPAGFVPAPGRRLPGRRRPRLAVLALGSLGALVGSSWLLPGDGHESTPATERTPASAPLDVPPLPEPTFNTHEARRADRVRAFDLTAANSDGSTSNSNNKPGTPAPLKVRRKATPSASVSQVPRATVWKAPRRPHSPKPPLETKQATFPAAPTNSEQPDDGAARTPKSLDGSPPEPLHRERLGANRAPILR